MGAGRELETPAFRPVYLYGPLVGTDVRRDRVIDKLSQVRGRIKGLAGGGAAGSDVVVFYYRGDEQIGAAGNVLHMAGGHEDLTCDYLVLLRRHAGAHVLMFDVSREGSKAEPDRDKVARWDDSFPDVKSHVAVLRYAFLGRRWAEVARPGRGPGAGHAEGDQALRGGRSDPALGAGRRGPRTKFDAAVNGPWVG